MELRTKCDPEANGRKPQLGESRWTIHFPLETGETCYIHMGKEGRDKLFGMLIAERVENCEPEPEIEDSL